MVAIDRRAGSQELFAPLQQMGIPVRLTTLDSADLAFDGHGPTGPVRVGVEVKTLADYLQSLASGRWTGHQLPKLTAAYPYRYLLIEGLWRPALDGSGLLTVPAPRRRGSARLAWVEAGHTRRWLYSALQRSLLSLEHLAGVTVLRSPSRADTLHTLWALYDWWQDAWTAHHSYQGLYKPDRAADGRVWLQPPSVARTVAACLPGIDWEYSGAAEQRFGSIRAMATASAAAWAEVRPEGQTKLGRRRPKLGLAKARQIVDTLTKDTRR